MNKYNDNESKLLDSIFETIARHSAGTVKTFVDETCVNRLKSFQLPSRIEVLTGEHPLIINDTDSKVLTPLDCTEADGELPNNPYWNVVMIYHEGLVTRSDILDALFEAAGDAFFVPMAYRHETSFDYFFVSRQNDMIKVLVGKSLQIEVKGYILPIVVKINVASHAEGHMKPIKSILSLILRKVNDSGVTNTLDFSRLAEEREMAETCISLRNKPTLLMFLDQLSNMRNLKVSTRALKFDENDIETLEPFASKLFGFNALTILSLNNNSLRDIGELQHLRKLNLEELLVEGMFGVQTPKAFMVKYEKRVGDLLPTLKKINGITLTHALITSMSSTGAKGDGEIKNVGDGVLVTAGNIKRHRCRKLMKDYCWTKVTLRHERRFSEREIMRHLTRNVLNDILFFPCYFRRVGDRDEFYLYKNGDALERLFATSGLKLQIPGEFVTARSSFPVEITFNFNVAEFSEDEVFWYAKIATVVAGSIDNNVLNLNDFPRRAEFAKMIVPMTTATIEFVVTQAKKLNPNIARIDMRNCGLETCESFDCMYTFPRLTCMDLRDNSIVSLENFKRCVLLTEIHLDDNPVCARTPADYIAHVTAHLPRVRCIDGLRLGEPRAFVNFQNYLVRAESFPAVDAFVRHFFRAWDSFERTQLLQLYADTSVFTLAVHYEHMAGVSFGRLYPRVQALIAVGRNLTKIANMNQVCDNVFIGERDIRMVFSNLMRTRHNLATFTVDVPLFEPETGRLMVIVSGAYEEVENELTITPIPFGFRRSFLIAVQASGKMRIWNDQLVINAPSEGQLNALRDTRTATEQEMATLCADLMPSEAEERAAKIVMLMELTKCTRDYCHRLLRESSYDFKVALACFTTYMDANEVSDDKFMFK